MKAEMTEKIKCSRANQARAHLETAAGPRAVPAHSGQEAERTVKCFLERPCIRTRCEPGRLAVRPLRSQLRLVRCCKKPRPQAGGLLLGELSWFDGDAFSPRKI